MSDPLSRLVRAAWDRGASVIAGLRRQAPGARMIGEMAVRQAAKSVQRPSRLDTTATEPPSHASSDTSAEKD